MAFGQPSGPPASARQVRELLALLHHAGHRDFRDARGPLGFTQRQAAGNFKGAEAASFIELLEGAAPGEAEEMAPDTEAADTEAPDTEAADTEAADTEAATAPPPTVGALTESALHQASAEQLAAELRRRGWAVTKP